MPKPYHVVSRQGITATLDSAALAGFLAKDGQLLLPILDLIESAECAVDAGSDGGFGQRRVEHGQHHQCGDADLYRDGGGRQHGQAV